MTTLSERGAKAANTTLRIDWEIYSEAVLNEFDPVTNPDGTLPLNVAENRLSWPILKERIEALMRDNSVPDWVASYTSTLGAPELRKAAVGFLERSLTGCPIDPDRIAFSAGATSIVEMSSFLLGNPGDVAVFPAPCYPVYRQGIGNLPALERYDIVTHETLDELAHGPPLTTEHLDTALADIEASGKTFRMLVITNPDNPTGGIYSESKLNELAEWCIVHRIHMIVNEIYGLSLIDHTDDRIRDDYPTPPHFTSFAPTIQSKESDYLHLWYAFSKDFGISGFRVGLVYSHNEEFITAYKNTNLGHTVSGHTQWLMQLLLEDSDFISSYIANSQERLTNSYAEVVTTLKQLGIPYAPAGGSLFVWLDLSEFISQQNSEAEIYLWMKLYEQTGILLTPGNGFGHLGWGRFRLVFPCVSRVGLVEAMRRLAGFVTNERRDRNAP
jgi:aspartate/methionine/tyrosine aminotransferase